MEFIPLLYHKRSNKDHCAMLQLADMLTRAQVEHGMRLANPNVACLPGASSPLLLEVIWRLVKTQKTETG
jgi:hypothetical protein